MLIAILVTAFICAPAGLILVGAGARMDRPFVALIGVALALLSTLAIVTITGRATYCMVAHCPPFITFDEFNNRDQST